MRTDQIIGPLVQVLVFAAHICAICFRLNIPLISFKYKRTFLVPLTLSMDCHFESRFYILISSLSHEERDTNSLK